MISKTGQTGFPTGVGQAQGLVVAHENRPEVLGHEVELVGNPSGQDDISLENGIVLPNWDDGSSGTVAVTKANEILALDADTHVNDNDILAVIGLSNSTATQAVIPLFSAAQYLHLATASLGTQLNNLGLDESYFARTSPTGALDAIAMADHICGDPACGDASNGIPCKVATIHDGNTAFSQTVAQAFADRCVNQYGALDTTDGAQGTAGVTGIKVITANPAIGTDYSAALTEMMQDADGVPDFVYHITNTVAAGNFVRQIRTVEPFLSTFSATRIGAASNYLADALWQAANGISPSGGVPLPMPLPLAEGFLVSAYDFDCADYPGNCNNGPLADFYADYDDLFGTLLPNFPFTITNLTPSAADAYGILLDAIEKVAIVINKNKMMIPRKALRDALLLETDVQGLTGALNCNNPSPGGQGPNFAGDCNPDIQVMITEVQCTSASSCQFVPQ